MTRSLTFLMVLASFMMMPAIATEHVSITNNAKILCENSSAENTLELILDGENLHITGLLDHWITSGRMSINVDYQKHELAFADIDKKSNLTIEGAISTRPEGNESSFKVSGKNLRIIRPCDKDVAFGGIICRINFTSRKTSISSAW